MAADDRQDRAFAQSETLYRQACETTPGGVHSHFRMMAQPHPLFFRRGQGAYLEDEDGNRLLDFTLGQGPSVLGHAHPRWVKAVTESLREGAIYAGQHRRELELAEVIVARVPCAEMVRIGTTGSEANHAALRLARAVTGRPLVVRFAGHYHGWLDDLAVGIDPAAGRAPWSKGQRVPSPGELTILPWNDLQALQALFTDQGEQVAAVIMEPVMCNTGCIEPLPGYLEGVRALCDRHGAALIFDEVITGFRLAAGGAQEHYGVTPDLATFGKAVAGGMPLAVLAGRRSLMEALGEGGGAIHAGTLNSNVPATAAALATLEILGGGGAYAQLYEVASRLRSRLAGLASPEHPLVTSGPGPVFHLGFSPVLHAAAGDAAARQAAPQLTAGAEYAALYDGPRYAGFCRAMLDEGVRLIGRGIWYICLAHGEQEVVRAVAAAERALDALTAPA